MTNNNITKMNNTEMKAVGNNSNNTHGEKNSVSEASSSNLIHAFNDKDGDVRVNKATPALQNSEEPFPALVSTNRGQPKLFTSDLAEKYSVTNKSKYAHVTQKDQLERLRTMELREEGLSRQIMDLIDADAPTDVLRELETKRQIVFSNISSLKLRISEANETNSVSSESASSAVQVHHQPKNRKIKMDKLPNFNVKFSSMSGQREDDGKPLKEGYFKTAKQFLDTFESTLLLADEDLDTTWSDYLHKSFLCSDDDMAKSWYKRELRSNESLKVWKDVRKVIEKKFLFQLSPMEYGARLLACSQRYGEPLQAYFKRLVILADKAEVIDGYMTAIAWHSGLHKHVKSYVTDQLIEVKCKTNNRTVRAHSVIESNDSLIKLMELFNKDSSAMEREIARLFDEKKDDTKNHRKRDHSPEPSYSKKRKLNKDYGKRDREYKTHSPNKPSKSQKSGQITNPCRYCKKVTYFNGHKCDEFYEAKKKEAKKSASKNFTDTKSKRVNLARSPIYIC